MVRQPKSVAVPSTGERLYPCFLRFLSPRRGTEGVVKTIERRDSKRLSLQERRRGRKDFFNGKEGWLVFENNTALEKSDVEVWGNLVVSQKTLIFALKKGDYIMNIEEKKADFMRRFKASRERKAEYIAQMEKRMRDDYRRRTGKEAESFCVL